MEPIPIPTASEISYLDHIECRQSCDLDQLRFLYLNRDKLPVWTNKEGERVEGGKEYVDRLFKAHGKNNTIRVCYTLSAKSQLSKLGYGRLYGNNKAYAYCEHTMRGLLASRDYVDLDIKNCFPTLLTQYARRYFDTDLPLLRSYVEKREDWYKLIDPVDSTVAKHEVMRAINGGIARPVLVPMQNEVREFVTKVMAREEYKPLVEHFTRLKQSNIFGKFVSAILQTEERRCLMAIRWALNERGFNVGALIYDGCLIEQGLATLPLEDIEKSAGMKCGYDIKLTIKPFEPFDTTGFTKEEKDGVDYCLDGSTIKVSEYKALKEEFEKQFFHYYPANTLGYFEGTNFCQFSHENAKGSLGNTWKFGGEKELAKVSFLTWWWNVDPARKTIKRISFHPSDDPMTYVREIQFAYTKPEPSTGAVKAWYDLLDHVCDKDRANRDYLEKWFARIVQQPLNAAGSRSCVIVTGDQGTGKDMLGEFFGAFVVGRDYYNDYTSTEQFWEKHDCGTEGRVFVKLQEAVGALNRKNAGRFKARITAPVEQYNPKGQKAYTCDNLANYYITTNETDPVRTEETNRRFWMIRSGNYERGNLTFWNGLVETLMNPEAGAEIGQHLAALDLTGFTPNVMPATETMKAAVEMEIAASDEPLMGWIESWDGAEKKAMDLYVDYKAFAPRPIGPKAFCQKLGDHARRGGVDVRLLDGFKLYRKRVPNTLSLA